MLTKQQSDEFIVFLKRYLAFYENFVEVECQKYETIAQNDIETLDSFVTKEQALLLQSRGLEAERDKIMDGYGHKETTLREFLPLLDASVSDKAKDLYSKLSNVMLDLKDVNSRCNQLTQLRLHRIDTELKRLENLPVLEKKYYQNAQTDGKSFNHISRKI